MIDNKYNLGGGLPLGFSMALAHNISAFNAFLSMDDATQDEIIEKSKNAKTKREMQMLVDGIPHYKSGSIN